MERTERQKVKFKKVGGGSFTMGNRIIKPGQVFEAFAEDIPMQFRNVVVPFEAAGQIWGTEATVKNETPILTKDAIKPVYTLQSRGINGLWWNIVDAQGKVLNEKALKKEVAEKLIEDLLK